MTLSQMKKKKATQAWKLTEKEQNTNKKLYTKYIFHWWITYNWMDKAICKGNEEEIT